MAFLLFFLVSNSVPSINEIFRCLEEACSQSLPDVWKWMELPAAVGNTKPQPESWWRGWHRDLETSSPPQAPYPAGQPPLQALDTLGLFFARDPLFPGKPSHYSEDTALALVGMWVRGFLRQPVPKTPSHAAPPQPSCKNNIPYPTPCYCRGSEAW